MPNPDYTRFEFEAAQRDVLDEYSKSRKEQTQNFNLGRLAMFAMAAVPATLGVYWLTDRYLIQPDLREAAPSVPFAVFVEAIKTATPLSFTNNSGQFVNNPSYIKVSGYAQFVDSEIQVSTNANRLTRSLIRTYNFYENVPEIPEQNNTTNTFSTNFQSVSNNLSITNFPTASEPITAKAPIIFTTRSSVSDYQLPFDPYLLEQRYYLPVDVTFSGKVDKYTDSTNQIVLRALEARKPDGL